MKQYKRVLYMLLLSNVSFIQAQHLDKLTGVSHTLPYVEYGGAYFADFNGDNKKDIILYGLKMEYPYQPILEIHLATRPLTYIKVKALELPGIYMGDLVINDLDKDGDLDVVISGLDKNRQPLAGIVLNKTGETFEFIIPENFNGLSQCSIGILDYNSDGLNDILMSGVSHFNIQTNLYLGRGNHQFQKTKHTFPNVFNGSILIENINQDKKPDVIISGVDKDNTFKTSVFLQSEHKSEFKCIESSIIPTVKGNIECIDLNGDALPDLLVNGEQMHNKIQLKAYINVGLGAFTPIELNEELKGSILGDLKVLDINNDRREDILLTGWNGETTISELYINKTEGWYKESLPIATRFSSIDIDKAVFSSSLNMISTGKTTLNQSKTHIWTLKQDKVKEDSIDNVENAPKIEIKNDILYISTSERKYLGTPEIYDVLGRNKTQDIRFINAHQLQIQNLPKGGYILKYSNFSLPFVVH